MRLVRVQTDAGPRWGSLEDGGIVLLTGSFADGFHPTPACIPTPARLLAPVQPTKIICAARNYAEHAKEMGGEVPDEPRIFLKAPSAVVGPGDAIALPPGAGRVDPEGELAVVIGRRSRHLTAADALQAVFGYTLLNDVTARVYQKKDGIFGRAKSFDSFCPVGPWVDTAFDPSDAAIQTAVNGEVRAKGRTSDMIFSITDLLVWISAVMTLEPGDVIATGTPPGVAPLESGDVVEVTVEGLGSLKNPVE
ncbi:MAG: fumarylacetoacetate hydrolase family protein [Alphaproteobacteria bacterium]|nr:fumarylacetoacetate hydrolase family protein [Alphaproteobacteria bacterium]